MYIFVNFANPLPSAHGRSILTRSACPLRLRRWIIRLRSLNYNLNVKKKKNESNIILKKNHNYREYLNFFSSSSKNIIFLLQKKNCTSLHAFSSSSFLVFTFKSILTLRDCILLWIKMEKISTQSIIVLTSWKLYSDGPLKMWYDSSRDILVIKITIVIEEYRNDVIVNI